jgi:phosphoribosylformylglycinamidine cyclo-ligase
VTGLVHVTGGGLVENPPRVFGDGLAMRLTLKSWKPAPVFPWLAKAGGIEGREMLRTFNCGLGMLVVVRDNALDAVESAFRAAGEAPIRVGRIEPRTGDAVVFDGLDQTWLA